MNITKGSKANTIKAATVFSLCILGFNPLLVWSLEAGHWGLVESYVFGECGDGGLACLAIFSVLVIFVSFASYTYGIVLGLGIIRRILHIEGNYLGSFAYALIGAVPTIFLPVFYFLLNFPLGLHPYLAVLGLAFAVLVGVVSGIGYVREEQGFSSWVRVLGVFSGTFFLIIGITYSISALLGYQT